MNNYCRSFTIFIQMMILIMLHKTANCENYYKKIGTENFELSCSQQANKRFHKNGTKLNLTQDTPSDYYKHWVDTDNNPVLLKFLIYKLNRTDNGNGIYKAYVNNENDAEACLHSIYLCVNQGNISETLEINGKMFNETINMTIDNPLDFNISYYYEINALPLDPSSIQFYINNQLYKTHEIDDDCTSSNNNTYCYKKDSFIHIDECPGQNIKIKPIYKYTADDPLKNECDFHQFSPIEHTIDLFYNLANVTATNENETVTLNDTLEFNYTVICANPNDFTYSANRTTCGNDSCDSIYTKYDSTNQNYLIEYKVEEPFVNITFDYCVDNTIKSICNSRFYVYREPGDATNKPKPWYEEYWWIWLIVGIFVLSIIVVVPTVVYCKKKQKGNGSNNRHDSIDDIPMNSKRTNEPTKSHSSNFNNTNEKGSRPPPKRQIVDNEVYGRPDTPEMNLRTNSNQRQYNTRTNNDNNIYGLTDDQINNLYAPINNRKPPTHLEPMPRKPRNAPLNEVDNKTIYVATNV